MTETEIPKKKPIEASSKVEDHLSSDVMIKLLQMKQELLSKK